MIVYEKGYLHSYMSRLNSALQLLLSRTFEIIYAITLFIFKQDCTN